MAISDRGEEILENLWVELLERGEAACDTAALNDDEALEELAGEGYVIIKKNQVVLTHTGREEAKNCVRRHRLAERLFVDILDVKKKSVHEQSCKFEHLLHKGLDDNICTLLGHPKTCPHGKPIPEGACCREAKKTLGKLIMPLPDLVLNRKSKISYLQTQNRAVLQKILAIGALPNTEITLIRKFPSYVIQIGKSQFAIDMELASHIFVRIG